MQLSSHTKSNQGEFPAFFPLYSTHVFAAKAGGLDAQIRPALAKLKAELDAVKFSSQKVDILDRLQRSIGISGYLFEALLALYDDAEDGVEKPKVPQIPEPMEVNNNEGDSWPQSRPNLKRPAEQQAQDAGPPSKMGKNQNGQAMKFEKKRPSSPFRRVRTSKEQLRSELQDNSYKATDPWGNRAAKDFSTVRGKNFRHEKTKKKRGTYAGGRISMEVNSIKFDESD
ncbi:SRP40, C-terminal domain-containing protein [Aphelenchoides fujianensis]|nr:SRP40, C-terminal domain-containing protein [Aphelenchoides fujianensis]